MNKAAEMHTVYKYCIVIGIGPEMYIKFLNLAVYLCRMFIQNLDAVYLIMI